MKIYFGVIFKPPPGRLRIGPHDHHRSKTQFIANGLRFLSDTLIQKGYLHIGPSTFYG